jgi:monofunctional biosynthetic peptidoglycan transglycosylase
MAAKRTKPKRKSRAKKAPIRWYRNRALLLRWTLRGLSGFAVFCVLLVVVFGIKNPPSNIYMISERIRLGSIKHEWISLSDTAPHVARSFVAAEDANFCHHWGFDVGAIRLALEEGANRGASTISQQVAKNVFLWPKRTWFRKGMEVGFTLLIETFWTKRRVVEVYMNIAEFDEGVFGVAAAGQHYFGRTPANLTETQAARLASVLPNPKSRSARNPAPKLRQRAVQIISGARTIEADGRSACFED